MSAYFAENKIHFNSAQRGSELNLNIFCEMSFNGNDDDDDNVEENVRIS